MNLSPAQLGVHLAKGLKSLYTVHGDEPLLVQETLDALRAAARARGYSERTVFVVSGAHFNWGEVGAACGSQSLFADRQIVEVQLPGGKPGKEGSLWLQRLAERVRSQDDTLLLVVLPRLDGSIRASAWLAALETGVVIEHKPVGRAALPQWLAQRLAAQDQRVAAGEPGQQALAFFADRVEGNLLAAHQEIQKLGLLYPPGELTLAQIAAVVLNVARYDVFKLSEATLGGQLLRVQRMLEGLQAEGTAEVLVLYTLAEDIRALKRVRDALDRGAPLPMALREQRIWGDKEALFARVLPRLDAALLAQLLHGAHQVDGIVKGLKSADWPTDSWQALHQLASRLCRACSAGAPQRPAGGRGPARDRSAAAGV